MSTKMARTQTFRVKVDGARQGKGEQVMHMHPRHFVTVHPPSGVHVRHAL